MLYDHRATLVLPRLVLVVPPFILRLHFITARINTTTTYTRGSLFFNLPHPLSFLHQHIFPNPEASRPSSTKKGPKGNRAPPGNRPPRPQVPSTPPTNRSPPNLSSLHPLLIFSSPTPQITRQRSTILEPPGFRELRFYSVLLSPTISSLRENLQKKAEKRIKYKISFRFAFILIFSGFAIDTKYLNIIPTPNSFLRFPFILQFPFGNEMVHPLLRSPSHPTPRQKCPILIAPVPNRSPWTFVDRISNLRPSAPESPDQVHI